MAKNNKKSEEIIESTKLGTNDRRKMENDSVVGNLYNFKYASATATVSHPIILSVFRTGKGRVFRANNGNAYMAGITLGDLDTGTRKLIIEKLQAKKRISYSMIKRAGVTFKAKYRVYNFSKMHNLSLVDTDIYLETL
tara:strand:- start:1633 stop:2046 length:414 start_codon:yes stop_codon:yes gene_type:complete